MKRWDIVLANDEAERPSSGPRRTAFDVRGEHRVLAGFSDEELAALALVPEGTGLRLGVRVLFGQRATSVRQPAENKKARATGPGFLRASKVAR